MERNRNSYKGDFYQKPIGKQPKQRGSRGGSFQEARGNGYKRTNTQRRGDEQYYKVDYYPVEATTTHTNEPSGNTQLQEEAAPSFNSNPTKKESPKNSGTSEKREKEEEKSQEPENSQVSLRYTVEHMRQFLSESRETLDEKIAYMNRKIAFRALCSNSRASKHRKGGANNGLSKNTIDSETKSLEKGFQNKEGPPEKPKNEAITPYERSYISQKEKEIKEKLIQGSKTTVNRSNIVFSSEEQTEMALRENLNKLTPQNIHMLKFNILDEVEKAPGSLNKLIELILEKAWQDLPYCETYANLCLFIDHRMTPHLQKTSHFKKTLCFLLEQRVTQIDHDSIYEVHGKKSGIFEKSNMVKKHKMGIVYFIATLIKKKMIPMAAVSLIIQTIIKNFLKLLVSKRAPSEFELEIECLIRLFDTIGEKMQRLKKSDRSNEFTNKLIQFVGSVLADMSHFGEELDQMFLHFNNQKVYLNCEEIAFEFLMLVAKKSPVSTRIKVLIGNLCERRDNRWEETLAHFKNAQTLEEVKEQMEKETQVKGEKGRVSYSQSQELEYVPVSRSKIPVESTRKKSGNSESNSICKESDYGSQSYQKKENDFYSFEKSAPNKKRNFDKPGNGSNSERKGVAWVKKQVSSPREDRSGKRRQPVQAKDNAADVESVGKLLQAYFELTKRPQDTHSESLDEYLLRISKEHKISLRRLLLVFLKEFVQNGYRDVIEKRAESVETFFLKRNPFENEEINSEFFIEFLRDFFLGSDEISRRNELLVKILHLFFSYGHSFESAIVIDGKTEEDPDLLETWTDFFKDLQRESTKFSREFVKKVETLLLKNKMDL